MLSRGLLLLPTLLVPTSGNDFDQFWKVSRKLLDKLFKNYDSTISPYATRSANFTWNANGSYASVMLLRSRLLSMQEREQQFSTATGVIMEWTDPRLTWNPDQYAGIDHLYVRRSKVWMPEIVPCESTAVTPVALFETTNVKIYPNGEVILLSYFFATHNCEIKADNFPFDINHCMICFSMSGNYAEELLLRGAIAPAPDLFGTGEFDYESFKQKPVMCSTTSLSLVSRSSGCVSSSFPSFFGEESHSLNGLVELGLTGMMSLTVIVGILNDSIAKGKDLSALGQFVFYDIMIVVVAVIVILFAHKLRRRLRELSDEKLKANNSSEFWAYVKRYGASTTISRYILFSVFLILHCLNLIMMLVRPADTGAFQSITTFNATYS
ncbi:hypothetical protein PRIPAC_82865 [Pristionchus pacificus]|uniref:Transmembrane ion channel n=1 Tax=Pristionchus pacificus TaxID=54126 RepID=A0A2A6CLK6_PRIPA|nr:hypothetical protein PRIPAC_82865 [Pristionchus pacificus]|eukprot:PDM79125.1 transmembrane ion channel [Pristionchus pacificus]